MSESISESAQEREKSRQISPFRTWTIIFLLALIFALAIVDRVILSMMIAPIKRDLALSDSAFGLAQGAAVALFYLVFAVPFGWASDRFDRRWILFLGISIWSLASAACGLVRNFGELFAARSLVGAGEAVLGPAGYPMIAGLVQRNRLPIAMMIFYLGGNLGNALGQFLGGSLLSWLDKFGNIDVWLFGDLQPWRVVFLLTGLPGLILALLIFLAPRQEAPPPRSAERNPASIAQFAAFFRRHRRFYLSHNIGMGLQQAALMATILWNAAFMTRTYGWTPGHIGMVFGSILLATSAAAVIGHTWIMSKLFARGMKDAHLRWQLIMSCMTIPMLALAYLWHDPVATCIGFALASLFNGGSVVAGPTSLQLGTPSEFRGRVSGIYVVIATMLGTAIGPSSIGFVTDYVIGDEQKVGIAIAGASMLFCAGAAIAFWTGLAATRRLMAESEESITA